MIGCNGKVYWYGIRVERGERVGIVGKEWDKREYKVLFTVTYQK